jgi:hypothetical protein
MPKEIMVAKTMPTFKKEKMTGYANVGVIIMS